MPGSPLTASHFVCSLHLMSPLLGSTVKPLLLRLKIRDKKQEIQEQKSKQRQQQLLFPSSLIPHCNCAQRKPPDGQTDSPYQIQPLLERRAGQHHFFLLKKNKINMIRTRKTSYKVGAGGLVPPGGTQAAGCCCCRQPSSSSVV